MASSADAPPPAAAAAAHSQQQQLNEDTQMAGTEPNQGSAAQAAASSSATTANQTTAAAAPTTTGSQQQQQPASPPLPTRHIAVTPGPRASRFQDVLDSSLRHTLGKISYDNFASCFPTVAARNPTLLKLVQSQMVDRLSLLCKKEFDSVVQARNVVARLNELEALVGDAEQRRGDAAMRGEEEVPVPPHTLPPERVLAAHMAPHLAQQQSQLNARLQTTQSHNARLWDDIQRQRAEIETLVSMAEKVLQDVDAASAMLDGGTADELARETRAVEGGTL